MTDSAYPHKARRRDLALIVRRVLWSIYTLPATALFLWLSIAAIVQQGKLGVADLVVSMPLYVAAQLHIWDKRTLTPVIWRVYAFAFVAWQVAYVFVLAPSSTGKAPSWSLLPGFAIQLPLLLAVFLYAFRRWSRSASVPIEVDRETRRRTLRVVAMSVSIVLLGGLILSAAGMLLVSRYPEYSLANLMPSKPVFKPSVAPPAPTQRSTIEPQLTSTQRNRLRILFEKGEFEALNRELEVLQQALDTDISREFEVTTAFRLFTRPGDGELLDKWVAHDGSTYQPYVARAEYCMQMAWRDRGTEWASKTSQTQFRRMEWWVEQALADADAALAENPMSLNAHTVRIAAQMASGDDVAEKLAFDEALDAFPDSYVLYEAFAHANRPRWGGSYEEMNRLGVQARADNPGDARFYALFGMIYEDQAQLLRHAGRDRQAIELYRKALEYGETGGLYEQRANTYLALNNSDAALADSERAVSLDPYSVDTRLLRTTIYAMRNDNKRAAAEAYAANELAPEDPKVQQAMSWVRRMGYEGASTAADR